MGRLLAHDWKVFGRILKGVWIVLGKIFGGQKGNLPKNKCVGRFFWKFSCNKERFLEVKKGGVNKRTPPAGGEIGRGAAQKRAGPLTAKTSIKFMTLRVMCEKNVQNLSPVVRGP